jgi:predicted secreted Zn-dependent protease
MSQTDEGSSASTPAWALERAREELHDVKDAEVIAQRAQEIARERQEREDERHNEYDDPDQGGEG